MSLRALIFRVGGNAKLTVKQRRQHSQTLSLRSESKRSQRGATKQQITLDTGRRYPSTASVGRRLETVGRPTKVCAGSLDSVCVLDDLADR